MKNWIYILIGILVLFVVLYILGDKRQERIKKKIKELREERQSVWRETRQKERLREQLNKKLHARSRLVSFIIISTFISASIATGLWAFGKVDISSALSGIGIVEILILVASQFFVHKPHEVRHYLNQVKPYLKDKIFANYQSLDEEIARGHERIHIIDAQIKKLQYMIAT